jgi:hypothetical protein
MGSSKDCQAESYVKTSRTERSVKTGRCRERQAESYVTTDRSRDRQAESYVRTGRSKD